MPVVGESLVGVDEVGVDVVGTAEVGTPACDWCESVRKYVYYYASGVIVRKCASVPVVGESLVGVDEVGIDVVGTAEVGTPACEWCESVRTCVHASVIQE